MFLELLEILRIFGKKNVFQIKKYRRNMNSVYCAVLNY